MGRIRTGEPRVKLPDTGPVDPSAFGGAFGPALQNVGASLQRLDKRLEQRKTQRESSALNAKSAETQANLTIQWNETMRTADPHDDQVAERFQSEVVVPALQELSGIATTRDAKAYFTRLQGGINAHFLTVTATGEANLAGAAAVSDFETSKNQLANAAGADPASTGANLALAKAMADNMVENGSLKRIDAIRLENEAAQQIAVSGVNGLIDRNPPGAEAWLRSGELDDVLGGQLKSTLINRAQAAQASGEAAAKRAIEAADEEAMDQYQDAMIADDGSVISDPAQLPQIRDDPRLKSGSQRILMNLHKAAAEGNHTFKDDPATVAELTSRSGLERGDPARLTDAMINQEVANENLTLATANTMRKSVALSGTPQGQEDAKQLNTNILSFKSAITESNPLAGIEDRAGDQRFGIFSNKAATYYHAQRALGISHSDLVTPGNPAYIGNIAQPFFSKGVDIEGLDLESLLGELELVSDPNPLADRPTIKPKPKGTFSQSDLDKM